MNTRMSKYDNIENTDMSRTKRNQDIYNSSEMGELSRFKSNTNVSIISDAPKEIDLEKIKNYLDSMDDIKEEKRRRLNIDIEEEKEEPIRREETRNYDINSVLEEAREKKEDDYEDRRHRAINNTQYDILKNIKISEEEKEEEESEELNTQEKTIVDLIQNIQKNGTKEKEEVNDPNDLFKSLMGDDENTIVMAPINEDEINKQNMKEALSGITTDLESVKEPVNDLTQDLILEKEKLKQEAEKEDSDAPTVNTVKVPNIDKSFYTNSMTFNKSDFEGFEEIEKTGKSSVFTKIAIVVAIILLLLTVLLIVNFIFDLNII